MRVSDFDYHLPSELIAQHPRSERSASRMLIVDRVKQRIRDACFKDLAEELPEGALLVLNDVKVFPARLSGQIKDRAGAVEILLLREVDGRTWEALVRPGRAIRNGSELVFGEGLLSAGVIEHGEEGRRILRFNVAGAELRRRIERFGEVPLPPYIRRSRGSNLEEDRRRYQTVFARRWGAIAAPTAGLHFTAEVLNDLKSRSIGSAELTHYVGYGTFQPIRGDRIEAHRMERERYEIPAQAAARLNRAKSERRPVFAVGTTVVRALESAIAADGSIRPGAGETGLFIHPPFEFRAVDGLLTNFHLPRSTLLMLVCALAGRDLIMNAYRHAVDARYRFYSYGDCMLIK